MVDQLDQLKMPLRLAATLLQNGKDLLAAPIVLMQLAQQALLQPEAARAPGGGKHRLIQRRAEHVTGMADIGGIATAGQCHRLKAAQLGEKLPCKAWGSGWEGDWRSGVSINSMSSAAATSRFSSDMVGRAAGSAPGAGSPMAWPAGPWSRVGSASGD